MSGSPATSKRDLRQEITDAMIAALEKGTAPWQRPWQAGALELPFNPTSEKRYRGGNAIHLMLTGASRGYEDPRWLTYRQALEKGWQVRKGEKGTQIEFWQFGSRSKGNDVSGDEPEGLDDPSRTNNRPLHRVYTVFNAKHIDGIPGHSPRVRQEWETIRSAESILQHSGAKIIHDQDDRAFYNRLTDSIHLPPKGAFQTPGAYFGTALHEASHWTGAVHRLNRSTLTESYRFGDLNYAKEELRAELASVFLMAERGVPHDPDRHAAYVSCWLEALRQDKHEIFRAARDAHRAADLLIALEVEPSFEKALASVNSTRTGGEIEERCSSPSEQPRPLLRVPLQIRSPSTEVSI
jgi:antirestriction protein ArdC